MNLKHDICRDLWYKGVNKISEGNYDGIKGDPYKNFWNNSHIERGSIISTIKDAEWNLAKDGYKITGIRGHLFEYTNARSYTNEKGKNGRDEIISLTIY